MKRNEKGFSAVEILLVLVIVSLIGFAGWYVWQAKNKNSKTTPNTSQTNTQTTKKEPETSKLSEFKSEELGVVLNYPTDWGTATLADGSLSKYQSGKYKQLSFSKATNVSVNFVTAAYSSPLDGCGYDDPVQDAQHAQNAKQASVIGQEGNDIKTYETRQNLNGPYGPAVYKVNMTAGDTGAGWTEITKSNKVLVYRDIDKPENRVKASDGEGCSPVTQAQADAANAFLSFYHYAANYSNSKVFGVNGQFDARKGEDATVRNQLIDVLNSVK